MVNTRHKSYHLEWNPFSNVVILLTFKQRETSRINPLFSATPSTTHTMTPGTMNMSNQNDYTWEKWNNDQEKQANQGEE